MFYNDNIFSKLFTNLDGLIFDKRIVKVFFNMIYRSIPNYSNILFMIGILAKQFVQSYTNVYDLGCSLGSVSFEICKNIQSKLGCQIFAVDNSLEMIKNFKILLKKFYYFPIKIIKTNICSLVIENASMVVLNFTLQFLPIKDRLSLLQNIYYGLNPNGILIISEKFYFSDKKILKILNKAHHEFKKNQGYSKLEIYQKKNSLKNVMILETVQKHKDRLKFIGFKNIELFYQCCNFGSLFAIK